MKLKSNARIDGRAKGFKLMTSAAWFRVATRTQPAGVVEKEK
jgi:hypothetical protein